MTRTSPDAGTAARPGSLTRLARRPWGIAVVAARHLRDRRLTAHRHTAGDASDRGPEVPPDLVDDDVRPVGAGVGPLFHRVFAIRVRDADLGAAALVARLTDDLDRAAPSEAVSFRKTRGRVGEVAVGDEFRVRMPAPWDGPVRVIHRDATSFRFATLRGHLEAGVIEFRARDDGGAVDFEIETWSRAGDRAAHVLFDRLRVGTELQLSMWTQFCLAVPGVAGGSRDGLVRIETRRAPWPVVGQPTPRPTPSQ